MDGPEHTQLIEKLSELKQTVQDRFSTLDKGLALNTQETTHQGKDIAEIKSDVKQIKEENVSRREFSDYKTSTDKLLETHSTEIESLIGTRNKTIGAVVILQIVWGMIVFFVSKFVK